MTENEAKAKLERTSVLWESATNTEMVEAVKAAIQALEEIQQYRAIGTVEELKSLKENERKCEDCAGCTVWKCDCSNIRANAIDEFANRLLHCGLGDFHNIPIREIKRISEEMKGGE